jgi:hypothetical protein
MSTQEEKIKMARACGLRWYYKNKAHVQEYQRQRRRKLAETEEGKEAKRAKYRAWSAKGTRKPADKQKAAARHRIGTLLQSGKITRLPCEKCGDPKSQAHHDDYSKPEEVRWLCQYHHARVHNPKLKDWKPELATP